MTPLLECDGLTRRFGERVAVDSLSFAISEGETYGLLGPNGAGKTTAISMIAGILRSDGGTVTVAGQTVTTGACPAKALVGLVPQDVALYDDLTARENLDFFGRLQGLSGRRLTQRADSVLDVVGLTDRAGDRLADFSGGMKRRANIAVGLLHEPRLLILDEPTVGVDPQSRAQILDSIEQLGGAGLAVLYTTHYMEEAERLCDRIGILDGGSLVAQGTRAELVDRVGEHDRVFLDLGSGLDDQQVSSLSSTLAALPGVVSVSEVDDGIEAMVDDGAVRLVSLIEAATTHGAVVGSAQIRQPDLEAVFLQVTGRALRD